MTDENAPMTDGYEWLDNERRSTEVYADAVHEMCKCHWDLHHVIVGKDLGLPAMKLIARRKGCPIHGAKGYV